MAYTKIRNIKTTINKAIDYITNPAKTNNSKFVYGYNVTPKTASIEFSFTAEKPIISPSAYSLII